MADKLVITSPVGRIVAGSLYKANDKDFEGKPLTVKTGQNAGQLTSRYFFALAIPKAPGESHWAYSEWGKQIWALGHKHFPQAAQRPDFAWKIEDGDSTVPNKRNRKPCENEGWPGNWIIRFSSSFAPLIYVKDNTSSSGWSQMMTPDFLKCGYYAQVNFNVEQNGQQTNSGLYVNPNMVAFAAYGPEISFGPNVEDAGFGAAALPAGASLTPPAASTLPAAPPAPGSSAPPPPGTAAPNPPAVPAVPPVAVVPNLAFVQVPPPNPTSAALPAVGAPPPPAPSSVPTPTVSPSKRMTPKAGVITYESYMASGWNDAQLIQEGLLIIQ
jgi:hypothetical protein